MKIKSFALVVALAAAPVSLFAQNNMVHVRVINAVPNSEPLTVSIGNTQIANGIAPNGISQFRQIPEPGDDQHITIQMGSQQVRTEETFDLDDDDENYTILVTPDEENNTPKVVLLENDRDDVDQDEVELMIINAAPEHRSVKVRMNDDVKARGINYGRSNDEDVDPGQYNMALIDASGSDTIIAQKSVTLTGGSNVTVLLTSPNNVAIVDDRNPERDLAGGNQAGAQGQTTGTATAPGAAATGAAATVPGAAAGTSPGAGMTTGSAGSPGDASRGALPGVGASPSSNATMTTPAMSIM